MKTPTKQTTTTKHLPKDSVKKKKKNVNPWPHARWKSIDIVQYSSGNKLSALFNPHLFLNIRVTLSDAKHKMTLVPPEESGAWALQDLRALLLTDEVTQPE